MAKFHKVLEMGSVIYVVKIFIAGPQEKVIEWRVWLQPLFVYFWLVYF